MSRLARKPIEIPKGVEVNLGNNSVTVKGKLGTLTRSINPDIKIDVKDNVISISAKDMRDPMVGTTCKLLKNLVHGLHVGFVRELDLVGVGYRAAAADKMVEGKKLPHLELSLGYSHPVILQVPQGITLELPTNTKIILKGADVEALGVFAADIKEKRPVEPYKGKGVRYTGEIVILKETKKK